jgi:hypothetical protein
MIINFMNEFQLFFILGHKHVLDIYAYDHILFLAALTLSYDFGQWKRLVGLVTLFTLGHTASIVATFYGHVQAPAEIVELLIPVTIITAAGHNIWRSLHNKAQGSIPLLFAVTLVFGIIHGFGFGRYFIQIAQGTGFQGFVAFALGIEWAQLVVVLAVLLLSFITQRVIGVNRRDWILVMSGIIIGLALPMLLERI